MEEAVPSAPSTAPPSRPHHRRLIELKETGKTPRMIHNLLVNILLPVAEINAHVRRKADLRAEHPRASAAFSKSFATGLRAMVEASPWSSGHNIRQQHERRGQLSKERHMSLEFLPSTWNRWRPVKIPFMIREERQVIMYMDAYFEKGNSRGEGHTSPPSEE